jgi:3-oxoacyl-(acyl-carrier-protein) synthase
MAWATAYVDSTALCVPVRAVPQDARRASPFMLYGLVAAAEALAHAGWAPNTDAQRRATGVAFGNGMSSTAEVAEAGQLVLQASGRLVHCAVGLCQSLCTGALMRNTYAGALMRYTYAGALMRYTYAGALMRYTYAGALMRYTYAAHVCQYCHGGGTGRMCATCHCAR